MIHSSVVAWEGPSSYNNTTNVQLTITGLVRPSANIKTGPIAQASIIVAGKHPLDVRKTDEVKAICGDCPHSPLNLNTCYVHGRMLLHLGRVEQYPRATVRQAADLIGGTRGLRVGEYGDPAFVPFEVWRELLEQARFWTGYTHAWRYCDQRFRQYLMASCETVVDVQRAQSNGWRTFRIRGSPAEEPLHRETVCTYEQNGTTCAECKLCRGTSRAGPNIVVTAHGRNAHKLLSLPVVQAA